MLAKHSKKVPLIDSTVNVERIIAFFGVPGSKEKLEALSQAHAAGYTILPLDTTAHGLARKANVSFAPIDAFVTTDAIARAQKEAEQCHNHWFKGAASAFTTDGICWPEFDQEAMYWFWCEALFAKALADSLLEKGLHELTFFISSPVRPSLYYYPSDIHAVLWQAMLSDHVQPITLSCASRSTENPVISFKDVHGRHISSASVLNEKLVFALNPAEFHRFSPIIKQLKNKYPGNVAAVLIFSQETRAKELSESYSIPVVSPVSSPSAKNDFKNQFLHGFEKSLLFSNGKPWRPFLKHLKYQFEFYCGQRLPAVVNNYRAWIELWSGIRPKALITSTLADSESQLPAAAATRFDIPTFSLPHASFPAPLRAIAGANYFFYSNSIQKTVFERSGVPADRLKPVRENISQNEYPAVARNLSSTDAKWRILALTDPIGFEGCIFPYVRPGKQLDALLTLDHPPEDISARLSLKIKTHPHWADLDIFCATRSSTLVRKMISPDSDLNALLPEVDLVIALNYCGSALMNVLKNGLPVFFYWTDEFMLRELGKLTQISWSNSELFLCAGKLVSTAEQLWKSIEDFFTRPWMGERLRSKAKSFAEQYLDGSAYPAVTEVVDHLLSSNNIESNTTIAGNESLIITRGIDEIIGNHNSISAKIFGDQMDYGEMPEHELGVLCKIVKNLQPKVIFEIGTFMGRTTLHLAANTEAQIYTLDLPPEGHIDYTAPLDHDPELDVYPQQPGVKFQNTPYATRIQQLYGDSQNFDFSPFYNKVDYVFVDANHHYEFVLRDSMNAFKMIKPNGVIIWHDYASYAPGVIRALDVVSQKFPIDHIEGTSLAVYFGKRCELEIDNYRDLSPEEKEFIKKLKTRIHGKDVDASNDLLSFSSNKLPSDSEYVKEITERLFENGNIQQAKNILLKFIENSPDDVNALTQLALIEYAEGNYPSAKEFLKGALIVEPSNDKAKTVLQNVHNRMVSV
jgi:hypothetical protein